MKRLLAILLLASSSLAVAGPNHGHGNRHGYYNNHGHHHSHWHNRHGWVVPAVIGGAVVYAATRPVVVQQPPVVVQQQNCSPWVETQNPDGTTTISRTCYQQ